MTFLRRHLVTLVLALGAGIVVGELWLLQRARADCSRALAALEQKKQEREWLARQSPSPSDETEKAIAGEMAALRDRIATLRRELQPRSPDSMTAAVPERPLDAYFEIANLVERARAQAVAARVGLRPDERFGFATFANEGPAPGQLEAVHRQRLAVQQVLEPLMEARPLALLAVRREQPADVAGAIRPAGDDFFALEPGSSLRREGLIDTEALRVEFTGQTSTLRSFLNGLSDIRQPVVVRSVDVVPLPPNASPRPAPSAGAAVPVVRQSLSKFAVTLEFVRVAGAPAPPES